MKKIIFFQAHPDDLEYFCSHLLHYLSKQENKYVIKIASLTKGEFSTPPHRDAHFKGDRLGKIREGELYQAHKIHGITRDQIYFFRYIDQMVKFNRATVEKVKEYLIEEKPIIIFAPEPINTYYRHPDHMAIGKILYYIYDKVLTSEHPKLYYYAPLNANFYWPFKRSDISFAFKLLDIHKSQKFMMDYVKPLYRILTLSYGRKVKGWRRAEGYRRVYYRNQKFKNKKLKFIMNCVLYLLVKVWPTDLSKYVPIPEKYRSIENGSEYR